MKTVNIRLKDEEVRILEELKKIMNRPSKSNVIRECIRIVYESHQIK